MADEPTPTPSPGKDWSVHPKVGAGAAAGAFAGLAVWGLHQGLGWNVPPEVAAQLVVVISFLGAYLFPNAQ